jgi:hypothetical protein
MVSTPDWEALDSWWAATVERGQLVRFDTASLVVDPGWLDGQASLVDDWWHATMHSERSVLVDGASSIDSEWLNGLWPELDPWWEQYLTARTEDITELLTQLDAADEAWAASAGRFDADPLSADWRTARGSTGPIRFTREEDWSYGLAHLLRSDDGTLATELFGEGAIDRVVAVETEAHLPGDDATTRYEDILISGPGGGVSIEVKIGDTNLRKSLDTAALVEQHHDGAWTHILLVPDYQLPDLRATFGDALSEPKAGPPVISATRSADIQVVYWQDVSAALRTLLQRDSEVGPHWAASAYVFCTLIEQRILGLVSRPVLKRMAEAADVVHGDNSLSVGIGDIEQEIAYLQATMEREEE